MATRSTRPASSISPTSTPTAPQGGRLGVGTLGDIRQPQSLHHQGVSAIGPARVCLRKPDGPQRRRAVHALWPDRRNASSCRRDRAWITFQSAARGADSPTDSRSRRTTCCSATQVLRDKGWPYHRSHYGKVAKAEKIGRAQRPLHLFRIRRRPRGAAAARPDADPACVTSSTPRRSSARRWSRRSAAGPIPSRTWMQAAPSPIAATPTGGRATCRSIAGGSTSMRSASSISATLRRCSKPSRPARSTFAWRTIRRDGSRATDFPAVDEGRVLKREFDTQLPSGMSALVFNTRRPPFEDAARAPRLASTCSTREWINRNLFNGLYQAHPELLRALVPLLARTTGRCTRARAAGAVLRAS